MATAQVIPNSSGSSRKGHLEAGRKKLEEFRKKKAEIRTKNITPMNQLLLSDFDKNKKFCQHEENVRYIPEADSIDISKESRSGVVVNPEGKATPSLTSSAGSSSEEHLLFDFSRQEDVGHPLPKLAFRSSFSEPIRSGYENGELKLDKTDNSVTEKLLDHADTTIRNHTSLHSFDEVLPKETRIYSENSATSISQVITDVSGDFETDFQHFSFGISESTNPSTTYGGIMQPASSSLSYNNNKHNDLSGSTFYDITNRHLSSEKDPGSLPKLSFSSNNSTSGSPIDMHQLSYTGPGTSAARQRPSFLDSLGVSRDSLKPSTGSYEVEKDNLQKLTTVGNVHSTKILPSFIQQSSRLVNTEHNSKLGIPDTNGEVRGFLTSESSIDEKSLIQRINHNQAQNLDMFGTMKKDEDFSALEQHIQDLTQEKFSLQRALEKSSILAESLASENSSLTESYNQQGKLLSQLKSDMERLNEEVKAQLIVLESMKEEYANAQLECSAADERAKVLASEVIGLEEKALRLKSNELKLQKQLENLNIDVVSYKRKVSILEKERQDFQLTIDAMQEEKKLLQSKLRKASASEKIIDEKGFSTKTDASTSTDDLGELTIIVGESSISETVTVDVPYRMVSTTELRSASFLPFDDIGFISSDGSIDIAQDQRRIIDNINSLILELAQEKEELLQDLKIESASVTKLKVLNKDLSRKLEAQTQRLELLTAQRMAAVNIPKPVETESANLSVEYADEGDEVVERVLGWIMKFFPGGTHSKRRASKLL